MYSGRTYRKILYVWSPYITPAGSASGHRVTRCRVMTI